MEFPYRTICSCDDLPSEKVLFQFEVSGRSNDDLCLNVDGTADPVSDLCLNKEMPEKYDIGFVSV